MLPEDDVRITDDEPNALEADELARFLIVTRDRWKQHYPMVITLVTTGMRMGAVRALRVEDLDPSRGIIRVRRRVSGKKHELVPGVKRGRKARDEVPLLAELHRVLLEHIGGFNETQQASGLLFPTEGGKMHCDSVLRKPFKDICKHAGIKKRFTPHGCRRTANDFYRRVSTEVVTRAITGHTTSRMHEHYSTVTAGEKLTAAEKAFADLFAPKVEQASPQAKIETASSSKVGDQWGTKWGTQVSSKEKGGSKLLN